MQTFKTLTTLALLTLASSSLAVTSTSTDHNTATMSVSASGTAADAVTFTVPSATVTINTGVVHPGSSFDVTIPVTNTTSRTITVTGASPVISGSYPAGKLTITPKVSSTDLAANTTGNLIYTFTFAPLAAGDQAVAGTTFSVTFNMTGSGQYDSGSGDTTF